MPNTFIENRDAWLRMSEVDYLGQFVKAWLGFNAWYRTAYSETQDRRIIDEIKWSPHGVLGNKVRPMLGDDIEDAAQLRNDIGTLHDRLERYEVNAGKGDEKVRITFRSVYLRHNPLSVRTKDVRGYRTNVHRNNGGKVQVSVLRISDNTVVCQLEHDKHDISKLDGDTTFQTALASSVRAVVRGFYQELNPKQVANLLLGEEPPIVCGSFRFHCGPSCLFAGVVEIIYLLRNTLFHGELHPTRDALACYEPAYRLVRRFLECID